MILQNSKLIYMKHPLAELLGIVIEEIKEGTSKLTLEVKEAFFNPNQVVHGGVLFSLADTGMGAALFPTLEQGYACASIEIKINYYRPVRSGTLVCHSKILNKGKTIANIEASVYSCEKLIATANGNFSIFLPRVKS
jgi:acyl-CoA thioesterase